MKGEKQNNKNKSKKEWRECVWVYGEDREEKIGVGTCVEEKKEKRKWLYREEMSGYLLFGLNWSERSNQRERDRERAQAHASGKAKQPKGDGLTPEQRRERYLSL